MNRAQTREEIKPLIELCKAGCLFEVQDWIKAGKPVNQPLPPEKGARPRSPLWYAIESGFHSLVRILLEAGAEMEGSLNYNTLSHALYKNRLDMVKLLAEHGADMTQVDMYDVFHTWQPEIMEFFIEHGADVETGNPLAQALCSRIRTALRIFKKYKDRFQSFQGQLNIALRHHCKEGNLKWVALCLWAGADPYAPGPDAAEETADPENDISALEYAALYEHFDVFNIKSIRVDPTHPVLVSAMSYAHGENASTLVLHLLKKGVSPNNQSNGGCTVIQEFLTRLQYSFRSYSSARKNMDAEESKERIKTIHILAQHGGKWIPENEDQITSARKSLLKMTPDYTVEFVWIMSKYKACSRENMEALLHMPSIRKHVRNDLDRINELMLEI